MFLYSFSFSFPVVAHLLSLSYLTPCAIYISFLLTYLLLSLFYLIKTPDKYVSASTFISLKFIPIFFQLQKVAIHLQPNRSN